LEPECLLGTKKYSQLLSEVGSLGGFPAPGFVRVSDLKLSRNSLVLLNRGRVHSAAAAEGCTAKYLCTSIYCTWVYLYIRANCRNRRKGKFPSPLTFNFGEKKKKSKRQNLRQKTQVPYGKKY